MKLEHHFEKIRHASSPSDIEDAFIAAITEFRSPRTQSRLRTTAADRSLLLRDTHPRGSLVPRIKGRFVEVAGEQIGIGSYGNSTGARYTWHYIRSAVMRALEAHGLAGGIAEQVYTWGFDYPWRALMVLDRKWPPTQ